MTGVNVGRAQETVHWEAARVPPAHCHPGQPEPVRVSLPGHEGILFQIQGRWQLLTNSELYQFAAGHFPHLIHLIWRKKPS